MLTYDISKRGNVPIYEFLYKCIRQDILQGTLPAEQRLPSKRIFAENLGVSVVTVASCYAQLSDEGYIYSKERKGFFVSTIKPLKMHKIIDETEQKNPYVPFAPHRKGSISTPDTHKTILYDFSSSQTSVSDFPFSVWARLMREILSVEQQSSIKQVDAAGTTELRKAIAAHIRGFRGMHVNENQIIVGAGAEYLYGLLIQLLGFEKTYGFENPGYRKLWAIYKNFGIKCAPIPIDSKGAKIQVLEKANIDIMHVTPSHHFPTGTVMSASRRVELLNWAYSSPQRYIIEDDYDSEFRFSGNPIPSLQSMDKGGRIIYINTFSQTLFSSIRISYMILPEALAKKFRQILGFYSCTVSSIEQLTLAKFINGGFFERHINRQRKNALLKRDAFINSLKKYDMAKQIEALNADSGLYFLVKIENCPQDIKSRLLHSGIKINALNEYFFDERAHTHTDTESTFIVNCSSLKLNEIEMAVKILCEKLADHPSADIARPLCSEMPQ